MKRVVFLVTALVMCGSAFLVSHQALALVTQNTRAINSDTAVRIPTEFLLSNLDHQCALLSRFSIIEPPEDGLSPIILQPMPSDNSELDGQDGAPGRDGGDGEDGRDGESGQPGQSGQPGTDGTSGQPGEDGARGRDGNDGS